MVNLGRTLPNITLRMAPSWATTQRTLNTAASNLTRNHPQDFINPRSSLTSWYRTATNNQSPNVLSSILNVIVTRMSRLRLGFPTLTDISNKEPDACLLCLYPQIYYSFLNAQKQSSSIPSAYLSPLDEIMARQKAAKRVSSNPDLEIAKLVHVYTRRR